MRRDDEMVAHRPGIQMDLPSIGKKPKPKWGH